ncbi:MAG: DUF1801 domain-containing protein [Gemmatimonadota bacterium]
MVSSRAATVSEYLKSLPAERRAVVAKVRGVVRKSLLPGFVESMSWGMICWEIPLARYPETYNGRPLPYAALAAQKNNYTIYLTMVYQDPKKLAWMKDQFRSAGKRLDMGKSCVHFRSPDDLPLDVIGALIGGMSVDDVSAQYETVKPPKTRAAKQGLPAKQRAPAR